MRWKLAQHIVEIAVDQFHRARAFGHRIGQRIAQPAIRTLVDHRRIIGIVDIGITRADDGARVLDQGLGFPGVAVFGVAVPGFPGKAGFAEVVTPGDFDVAAFARAALALPAHARPCFVRAVPRLDQTSTFKVKKRALELSSALGSSLVWVRQNGSYVVLTRELWDDLCRGQARL